MGSLRDGVDAPAFDVLTPTPVVSLLEGQTRSTVRRGYRALEANRALDALRLFRSALGLSPGDRDARVGENRAVRKLVPRWHFAMLNDVVRNEAYARAVAEVVRPGTTVLDIGTGSGLLAMLAARAGARRVTSCEMVRPLADVAAAIVASNGFAERVEVVDRASFELSIPRDLPERVDVVVTELVDCGLVGEGILPALRHARARLLRPGGTIVPRAARLVGALVESEDVHQLNHVDTACGFDVRELNRLSTSEYFPVRLGAWRHRFLTEPFEVVSFDFVGGELGSWGRSIEVTVERSGRCHGVACWFEMQLSHSERLTTDPRTGPSHWLQAMFTFPRPLDVVAGESLALGAHHDDYGMSLTPPAIDARGDSREDA